ncbi:galactose mutarotase-like protein [Pholiota conissans]|uniref:Galactose mutarotase-like protein n=1 Tax=Pholiota conissans TaxID=109636 RepID=A0A9P5ZD60_9AGAR|nr:galactose mutarotase-like protein [Pholiota conissans]
MVLFRFHLLFYLGVISFSFYSNASVVQDAKAFKSINLVAPDASIRASFMAFGATVTNLWVKDKKGEFRDIILGFDNHTLYQTQTDGHPYFGPVVGRYANRIRNGTFTIPISKDATGPNKFFVPRNENNLDSLHGGTDGFDQRIWETTKVSSNSVTFTLLDPDGMEGFPGTVITTVTYILESQATWKISMDAIATQKTPIMLSGHHYWNLEAYQESQDLVGHHAQFQSSKFIGTDGHLIPTGQLLDVQNTPLDFRKAKSIGASIPATTGEQFCGTGCVGFDNCWVFDEVDEKKAAFSMWSVNSGIKVSISTNQPALQVYTCNSIFNNTNPIPRKTTQGGAQNVYTDHSCVVIEAESIIDAINNPEFGADQIYGPGRPYKWESSYVFSNI